MCNAQSVSMINTGSHAYLIQLSDCISEAFPPLMSLTHAAEGMACLAVAWTAAASLPCIIFSGTSSTYVIAWASCGWGEVPEPRLPKGLYFKHKHKISPQHAK